jgi:hypothetical protein
MAIETQTISASNVVETVDRVFVTPDQKSKVDLLTVSAPTDLDWVLSKVNSVQSPIQNKGTFDASQGSFPADADSGWLYKVTVGGIIDTMTLDVGDVIFAIEDVLSTTSSAHWVKIENSSDAAVLRQTVISTDGLLTANSDTLIPSQKAVKTYVDTSLDALNTQLMDEINAIASVTGVSSVVVSDWIDVLDDGTDSVMTLDEPAKGIIRVYIEDWGDILKGWDFTADTSDVVFLNDVTHAGKRALITYLK